MSGAPKRASTASEKSNSAGNVKGKVVCIRRRLRRRGSLVVARGARAAPCRGRAAAPCHDGTAGEYRFAADCRVAAESWSVFSFNCKRDSFLLFLPFFFFSFLFDDGNFSSASHSLLNLSLLLSTLVTSNHQPSSEATASPARATLSRSSTTPSPP